MSEDERRAEKTAFLKAAGWGGARLSPLAGDASNRRYERAADGPGGARAVLMDAPSSRGEDIAPFLAVTGYLRARGLSAPEILHADIGAGFALIEDLGDDLFARVAAAAPDREAPCYEAAVDLLAHLHEAPPPDRVTGAGASLDMAPYDAAVLAREAALATDWWAPHAGAPIGAAAVGVFSAALAEATAGVAMRRDAFVLRDYHAENLLWLPDRRGDARVGLLDYQDALIGARAYDLVSLLEDARRDVDPALAERMIRRYVAATGVAEDVFRRDYAALGAQRNLKIVGIFARLWVRDGKAAYLDLIPRVWAHLERDLAHPGLAGLRGAVRETIPAPTAEALARVKAARA